MALLHPAQHETGISTDSAYWSVREFRGSKNGVNVMFHAHATKADRDALKPPLEKLEIIIPFDPDDQRNVLVQAYEAAKAKTEFAGAKDA